ncbi:MAG: hypothetical protein ABSA86_07280 [Oryzomonas sp.]
MTKGSIELFDCTRLAARISHRQCAANRGRSTFACDGCKGLTGTASTIEDFACPNCCSVLSTSEAAGRDCPVCHKALRASLPSPSQKSTPREDRPVNDCCFAGADEILNKGSWQIANKDNPVVVLDFADTDERLIYGILAKKAEESGTRIEDDILAILFWFVKDFSGGMQ